MICINNRDISFDDIINISKKIINNYIYKNNYYEIWKKKIEFLEKYFNEYYKEGFDFNYYNGLSYNALYIVKYINCLNLTYGRTYNRFYNIHSLYDLYNPINKEYGPIINSIAEYIKYEFFYNKREVEYKKTFSLKLSVEDYYYLIARLLFPTYFYDLFKDNINNSYQMIISRISEYINYVKRIIIDIKKRHNNMSYLDYIINLL